TRMTIAELVERLRNVRRRPGGWLELCPAHDDRRNSLSIAEADGRILLKCFAGCPVERIVGALGLRMQDLFPDADPQGHEGGSPLHGTATAQPPLTECTLAQYAKAKRLPIEFLHGIGLCEIGKPGQRVVAIPYRDPGGHAVAIRFRVSMTGPDRFRWKKGSRPCLYGLERLQEARSKDYVVLVEGESDSQTLCTTTSQPWGFPGPPAGGRNGRIF